MTLNHDIQGLPEKPPATESPIKQIFSFLSSMQLGIILLLVLAVVSVFATLKPNQAAMDAIYTSWWFVGIMAFTALNLFLCTVERIRPLWRQAMQPHRVLPLEAIKKMQVSRVIKTKQDGQDPLDRVRDVFRANGLQVTVSDSADGKILFGEKGKLGYFGSVITHLSILLILLGAMYGALTGYETFGGGKAGDTFFVREGNYHVTLNEITQEYPGDGGVLPKTYTDMSVMRSGQELKRSSVTLNQPLRVEGSAVYLYSIGWSPHLKVTHLDQDGITPEVNPYSVGKTYPLSENGLYLHIYEFFPDFYEMPNGQPTSRRQRPDNPVIAYAIFYPTREPHVWTLPNGMQRDWNLLPLGEKEVIETEYGDVELEFNDFEVTTLFRIAKNLGRPFLFIGAVLMLAGMYLSFFFFPRRFWAAFDSKASAVVVGGRGVRNRLGIEQIIERIESGIRKKEEK
jgi:cytochrome c biogenesis protein